MLRNTLGLVAPVCLLIASPLVTGCKKEEAPPPLPTAAPAVTTAAAPLQLKPIDAGAPAPVESAKPVGHGTGSAGGLGACCSALSQNATMAPEPTKTYMIQAAALCSALAAQGKDKAAIGGLLMGALKGAGMPSACK